MDEDNFNYIKIGPAGDKNNGAPWDEMGKHKIVRIFISHDDEIRSIQFQYHSSGTLVTSNRHGPGKGRNFDVVKLDYPSEYITWISGTNWDKIVSLTIGTNRGQYGPFGGSADFEFSFKLGDHQNFGGFHGSADTSALKSIGLYFKTNNGLPIVNMERLSL